jgi:beta-galactosidase
MYNDNQFHHGSCYYPEHWPESRWPIDAQKMVDAGFDTVRIGEFDWAVYEPEEGQYNFDRLEKAVDILYKTGLKVILGTPTITPPAWLTAKFPSCLRATDHDGVTQMPQVKVLVWVMIYPHPPPSPC